MRAGSRNVSSVGGRGSGQHMLNSAHLAGYSRTHLKQPVHAKQPAGHAVYVPVEGRGRLGGEELPLIHHEDAHGHAEEDDHPLCEEEVPDAE